MKFVQRLFLSLCSFALFVLGFAICLAMIGLNTLISIVVGFFVHLSLYNSRINRWMGTETVLNICIFEEKE